MKQYDGKVRVVFKNMVVHPQVVTKAHQGTCAAAKQGKFLAYTDGVWEKGFNAYAASRDPSKLGEDNLVVIAKEAGMDPDKFKADMNSPECATFVQQDMADLAKFKVNSTPAFFINGQYVGGALPAEGFKQIIDQRLQVAAASGVSGAEYYAKEVLGKGEKQFKSAAEAP